MGTFIKKLIIIESQQYYKWSKYASYTERRKSDNQIINNYCDMLD